MKIASRFLYLLCIQPLFVCIRVVLKASNRFQKSFNTICISESTCGRYHKLLTLILPRLGFLCRKEVYGEKYGIPIVSGIGIIDRMTSEEWMLTTLTQLFALPGVRDKLFIDVGVNVGQTLLKVKSIGKDIDYLGFEPNPMCVFYVQQLISLNGIKNARVVPVGLADENTLVELQSFSKGEAALVDSGASVITDFRPKNPVTRSQFVPVMQFDAIRERVSDSEVGMVKIDVEGAESLVLEGMRLLITQDRPLVACEILPVYSNDNMQRLSKQREAERLLNDLDYTMYRFVDGHSRLAKIPEIGIHGNLDLCDYLFVPNELVSDLESLPIAQGQKSGWLQPDSETISGSAA